LRKHGRRIFGRPLLAPDQQASKIDALARAAFDAAIAEKPAGMFMIRQRIRVVKRHPEGDW
jgi:hypothetical protein